jgi:hypothetical protein
MNVTVEELATAIASRRLVHQWIDKRCIPYEPHLLGLAADGRVLVVVRGVPSRENWSAPSEWKTVRLSAISEIGPKARFLDASAIPQDHLAAIRTVFAQVK